MVLIHEAGHFFMARLFGVKVLEFGVGFPPKAWSRVSKKSGIEYSVNWLPIGGFVRMDGENGDSTDPNSFGKKPAWQRAIILVAGPFMNLVLAFVIYLILSGGGQDNPIGQSGLIAVSPGSPAANAGLQAGDVILSIDGDNVKNYSDILLDITVNKSSPLTIAYLRDNQVKTVTVKARTQDQTPQGEGSLGVAAGDIFTNSQAPFQMFDSPTGPDGKPIVGTDGQPLVRDKDVILSIDGQTFSNNAELFQYLDTVNKDAVQLKIKRDVNGQSQNVDVTLPVQLYVSVVYKGTDADKAGLQPGEPIVAVDGTPVHSMQEYANYLNAHTGQTVKLTVLDPKTKEQHQIGVTANYAATGEQTVLDSSKNWSPQVAQRIDSRTGNGVPLFVLIPTVHESFTPVGMVQHALDKTGYAIGLIPRTFTGLFNGSVSVKQLSGPVGMAEITSKAVDSGGLLNLLILTALLSVNLGIVNILPLPALDGGRLVFVLIEMVTRGKRIPPEKEGLVHLFGMVVLLTLMVLISWNDIVRLISGGSFS